MGGSRWRSWMPTMPGVWMRCGPVPPPRAAGDLWARLRSAGARVRTLAATPQPEAHPRSAAGQAKVHHPAKLLGWISRHGRQRLRSASPPSPCPGVLFEDGPDGVDAFAEDDFSLRPTGSTSQPIEFPGGESGRDGEVSSFPPLPPVHQRPGFRITGRHRNGGMTRGQDNPSLARDNART